MEPAAVLSHYPAIPPPQGVRLTVLPEHACPYRPGRVTRNRAFVAEHMPDELYGQLMDRAFRRSGRLIYQPVCRGCRACVPIRVPVERFAPGKSQRRCFRRNQDLRVEVAEPTPTREKYELYRQYLAEWHGSEMEDSLAGFVAFLYDSPVTTVEFTYREPSGRLVGVGICDLGSSYLSSVYFYHDPAVSKRGVGTFSALYEIEYARRRGLAYCYLGYWVEGCSTMDYKASFRPHEQLDADGVWRPAGRA